MAALATIADLEARGVTVSPDETSAVNVYLEVASALVRDAADSPVSEETSTVTLTGTRDDWLRLPGGPVRSVAEITLYNVPVTDYTLSGEGLWRSGVCASERVPT